VIYRTGRRHFQWSWTTSTPSFIRSRHSLTLNIPETVRHYRQFRGNTNRDLHAPYSTVSFRMTLSDLEWLSKLFNDTKRRAVSLRQLSFLFTEIWRYIDFQNGGRPPSWNCFTTIRDHPRSLYCWPQLPVKFDVNLIHRSADIAIWIFRILILVWNAYSGPIIGVLGTLDP